MQDTPPYVLAAGNPCRPVGINIEGLKRRGFSPAVISALRDAYKAIYRRGPVAGRGARRTAPTPDQRTGNARVLQVMLDFLDQSRRGIIRP